mmetsp:Transcript_16275/g.67307  ORF Transcript_16275/g.67307 Transcript_16275/m.67307 type:complete len:217 (-) Transcript_16275:1015-1665(-)
MISPMSCPCPSALRNSINSLTLEPRSEDRSLGELVEPSISRWLLETSLRSSTNLASHAGKTSLGGSRVVATSSASARARLTTPISAPRDNASALSRSTLSSSSSVGDGPRSASSIADGASNWKSSFLRPSSCLRISFSRSNKDFSRDSTSFCRTSSATTFASYEASFSDISFSFSVRPSSICSSSIALASSSRFAIAASRRDAIVAFNSFSTSPLC